MTVPVQLPRYDRSQTYQWNYDHAPAPVELDVPAVPGSWQFCGLPVDSPLGIPAGPLLNGRWCLYYAALGFDVLTYKTVRSRPRSCYPLPNLQPVACGQLSGGETNLPAIDSMRGSWAVSFGMPSQPPDVWRRDVAETRDRLPRRKLLSVSVVGTVQEGWSIDDLAADYAQCARWAAQSGADCIELNLSCPNVATCDGQLYQQPTDAALVTQRVREAIGQVPLIAKIGRIADLQETAALLAALHTSVDALALTNSIAATVESADGALLFGGQQRGICGDATRSASISQCRLMTRLIGEHGWNLQLIGVGGIAAADHVRDYLTAGAHAVHIATAAMLEPALAITIRRDFAAAPYRRMG